MNDDSAAANGGFNFASVAVIADDQQFESERAIWLRGEIQRAAAKLIAFRAS